MHRKIAIPAFAVIFFSLSFNSIAAQAERACARDNFTGTYVFYEKGSSAVFPPASQNPSQFPFWAGLFAPFVTVGEVTMRVDGVDEQGKPRVIGNGFYWMRVGSINTGPDPLTVELLVTEFNDDCTGKFSYSLTVPGNSDSTTITERFILFDNGREFRTIPAEISSNGVPYLTWIGEGHRLSTPGQPLNTCGPQTAAGSYLSSVENFVQFDAEIPIFSDVLLGRTEVAMNGDYSGTLYEKLGPGGGIKLPVSGTIKVNPDCSYQSTLNVTIQGTAVTIETRGVYFDQGKKSYGLQVSTGGTQFSFGQGERITE